MDTPKIRSLDKEKKKSFPFALCSLICIFAK